MSRTTRAPAALIVALVAGFGMAQVASAATTVTLRESDFLGPLSDTRPQGEVTFLVDGLHVETFDTSGDAKAAEYWQTGGALPASASMEWFGDGPKPGIQIVFDFDDVDNNGNDNNILVGEPDSYGAAWWLTPASSDDAKAVDPSGADNTGGGSEWFGTLAEWVAAMPDARFLRGRLLARFRGEGRRRDRQHHVRRHRVPVLRAARHRRRPTSRAPTRPRRTGAR